ncbi:oxidoreductase [Microvirga tunisiensis]|uniref:Probable inorganic carbon transporter subunit DabB n=1 Tax=Pannonibacter tanglangensis TaxID=2750084 RepID=A0A7X5F679_9HYPH|nr:proton-conducting transporter membrane subunit [Pannonibacter sp. XCT-53]NBN79585.1 oxidoreductase [Pannonibacter sp. XCT-53]
MSTLPVLAGVVPALVTGIAGLAGPLLLGLVAVFALRRPGRRPHPLPLVAEAAGGLALLTALVTLAGYLANGAMTLVIVGTADWPLLALRVDVISVTMLLLVAFVGWAVLRYSRTYLDGEAVQGAFTGWLAATLALVMLLVTAGSLVQLVLAWAAVSYGLIRLLLTYPDRPGAQRAVAKKRFTVLITEASLVVAVLFLALAYQTTDIARILAAAGEGQGGGLAIAAAAFLALAAVIKSAQFPLHGWLTEVMEAPTPVSALLHAGVINAGGFLLIRFADVLLLSPGVMALLVILGGFTALFAALVMLTQPMVKTALAWSTVAQMGFMILQCGLGLFPLALLHILAHSLYKAHAFLSSGTAVAEVARSARPGAVAVPSGAAVGRAFLLAVAVYAAAAAAFGVADKSVQALALGAVLIFGVAYLLAQGFAGAAPRGLMLRTMAASLAAAVSYFALQALSAAAFGHALPEPLVPGPLETALLVLMLASFGAVAVTQAMFPLWGAHPAAAGLRVHLSNGFYANALLDRWLGLTGRPPVARQAG